MLLNTCLQYHILTEAGWDAQVDSRVTRQISICRYNLSKRSVLPRARAGEFYHNFVAKAIRDFKISEIEQRYIVCLYLGTLEQL